MMSVPSYDVETVRGDFPILAEKVYGKPLVYLDNGASAQKPLAVLDRMRHAYTHEYANVHRGLHYLSNAATEAYEDAREAVRAFLNAPSMEQVIFTRSSTEAINLVAASYGGMVLNEGDEVILSILEHHSNIVPWNFHREKKGRRHQVGAGPRRRQLRSRSLRGALHAAYQDRRHHADVQRHGAPSCRSRT